MGENPAAVALLMWTPGISAGLTALILKVKLAPYGWKSGKIKYWGYVYLLPVLVALAGYGLMWITGFTEFYTDVVNEKWARMPGFETPAPFVAGILSKVFLAFLFTSIFVLGEEIGWLGFLALSGYDQWIIWSRRPIVGCFARIYFCTSWCRFYKNSIDCKIKKLLGGNGSAYQP